MKVIDVYSLRNPNADPETKSLRKEYQKAIEEWNDLMEKYEKTPIEIERRRLEEKLCEANKKISRLKKKLVQKSDS